MVKRSTVVIADDHPLFRKGIRIALSQIGDIKIVAECNNADQVIEAVHEYQPDIILMDLHLPGSGIEAARQISVSNPEVRIVMMTVSEKESEITDAFNAGATGYVHKGTNREEFAAIVQSVLEGEDNVSPNPPGAALHASNTEVTAQLTEREKYVLKQVSEGLSNKEIAHSIGVKERTVKRYMTKIMRKLNVRNRVEAAVKARHL